MTWVRIHCKIVYLKQLKIITHLYAIINLYFSFSVGISTPLIDLQHKNRRQEMQKIQQMEDKQLKILFGVCMLFIVCHTCRICRHFEELIHKSMDVIKSKPCNEGCASIFPLSTHVRTNFHLYFVWYKPVV